MKSFFLFKFRVYKMSTKHTHTQKKLDRKRGAINNSTKHAPQKSARALKQKRDAQTPSFARLAPLFLAIESNDNSSFSRVRLRERTKKKVFQFVLTKESPRPPIF
jgi:hypothetical protein